MKTDLLAVLKISSPVDSQQLIDSSVLLQCIGLGHHPGLPCRAVVTTTPRRLVALSGASVLNRWVSCDFPVTDGNRERETDLAQMVVLEISK